MNIKDKGYLISQSRFQENHVIVKYLTQSNGLISFIYLDGNLNQQRSKLSIQLGTLTELVFKPKTSLNQLYHADLLENMPSWKPFVFVFQQYVHEIMLYLLMEKQKLGIFELYKQLLAIFNGFNYDEFDNSTNYQLIEIALRHFELSFLDSIGFGIHFQLISSAQNTIEKNHYYQFLPQQGFTLCENTQGFLGSDILAIQQRKITLQQLQTARKICKNQIGSLLSGRPLKSRAILKQILIKTP